MVSLRLAFDASKASLKAVLWAAGKKGLVDQAEMVRPRDSLPVEVSRESLHRMARFDNLKAWFFMEIDAPWAKAAWLARTQDLESIEILSKKDMIWHPTTRRSFAQLAWLAQNNKGEVFAI